MDNNQSNKKKKRGIGKKIILVILFIILLAGAILGYKVYKNGGGAKGLLMTAMGHDKDTILTLDKIYCLILGKSQNLTDTLLVWVGLYFSQYRPFTDTYFIKKECYTL